MIRHPNPYTDAKGYRMSDEQTFMYSEGESNQNVDTTHSPIGTNNIRIHVMSALRFEVDQRLMLPNRSNDPYVIKSIPKSIPRYNRRRGKVGGTAPQIKEWELILGGY